MPPHFLHCAVSEIEAKYARLQKRPKTNPFIDREGYHTYVMDRAVLFPAGLARSLTQISRGQVNRVALCQMD